MVTFRRITPWRDYKSHNFYAYKQLKINIAGVKFLGGGELSIFSDKNEKRLLLYISSSSNVQAINNSRLSSSFQQFLEFDIKTRGREEFLNLTNYGVRYYLEGNTALKLFQRIDNSRYNPNVKIIWNPSDPLHLKVIFYLEDEHGYPLSSEIIKFLEYEIGFPVGINFTMKRAITATYGIGPPPASDSIAAMQYAAIKLLEDTAVEAGLLTEEFQDKSLYLENQKTIFDLIGDFFNVKTHNEEEDTDKLDFK